MLSSSLAKLIKSENTAAGSIGMILLGELKVAIPSSYIFVLLLIATVVLRYSVAIM
jgi:hypothetical protein